jgi:hypothetical protein
MLRRELKIALYLVIVALILDDPIGTLGTVVLMGQSDR